MNFDGFFIEVESEVWFCMAIFCSLTFLDKKRKIHWGINLGNNSGINICKYCYILYILRLILFTDSLSMLIKKGL